MRLLSKDLTYPPTSSTPTGNEEISMKFLSLRGTKTASKSKRKQQKTDAQKSEYFTITGTMDEVLRT
jgi:hypothetical protein